MVRCQPPCLSSCGLRATGACARNAGSSGKRSASRTSSPTSSTTSRPANAGNDARGLTGSSATTGSQSPATTTSRRSAATTRSSSRRCSTEWSATAATERSRRGALSLRYQRSRNQEPPTIEHRCTSGGRCDLLLKLGVGPGMESSLTLFRPLVSQRLRPNRVGTWLHSAQLASSSCEGPGPE